MYSPGQRMADKAQQPVDAAVSEWMGPEAYARWCRVVQFISNAYPDVFAPDWVYGGKKHGWGLRYKKSKSFCTLIPERGRMALLIVFGQEERARAEAILPELSDTTRTEYAAATTYHDGKWVVLVVNSDAVSADVERLLAVKRKPKAHR